MRVLGLDIGSRSVEAVWLDEGAVASYEIADCGFDPASAYEPFLVRGDHDAVIATGYGRHAARETLECPVVTEITAYARGASRLFPEAASVLDIGGQDTKVITLKNGSSVADFEMNDKCAAGTGKFIEVMAGALGFSLEGMADAALEADGSVQISSMCTVFAESEVTGLVHRGEDRARISRGLHDAIAKRVFGSLKRIGAVGPLVFAGGVAKNSAMVELVRNGFDGDVLVPEEAQIVGAYGAALSYEPQ